MDTTNLPTLVSIVILNCNGLGYLKETIPCILRLDYKNYEVVVVDNGSIDGSLEYLNTFEKIRVIKNNKNLGYSIGKNMGIKNAKGKFVLLLDNDILITDPGILTLLFRSYSEKIGLVYTPVLDQGQSLTAYYGLYFLCYGPNYQMPKTTVEKILSSESFLIGSADGKNMFFKKESWEKVGGFDESQIFNLDDVDIGPRFYLLGFKNVINTYSYFIHLGVKHQNSVIYDSNRFRTLFSGHARSMIKNYRLKNVLVGFPLLYLYHFSKAVKYSLKRESFSIFASFLYSNYFFMKNFLDTLKQRKITQQNRVVKEDIFLKIKYPNFN